MQLNDESAKEILTWISNEETAKAFLREADPQDVANTAWAFATLGLKHPSCLLRLKLILIGLSRRESTGCCQHCLGICNTWIEAPKLFAEIEHRSSWLVKEGNPQDVANTAWAFATLGYDAPKLFAEIEQQSSWLVKEGNPQDVANTAWAFATLGYEAPKLFAEIEHKSNWLVKEGNPQAVANTAWAFATLGYDAPKLFAEIEAQSSWLVKEGNPQDVANTAWAFATLGYDAPKLFAEIEATIKLACQGRESTGCCQHCLGICNTWI